MKGREKRRQRGIKITAKSGVRKDRREDRRKKE